MGYTMHEDSNGADAIRTKADLYSEQAKLTPEAFLDARPDPEPTVVESMADLARHDSFFAELFMPQTKVAIWDVLLHLDERPKTTSEICERGAGVSPASFSRHKDTFVDWNILLEVGTDDQGRQLYLKNVRNPLVQTLLMFHSVARCGTSLQLLEEQFIREPVDDKPPEAYAVENADSLVEKRRLCRKFDLDPDAWIDDDRFEDL